MTPETVPATRQGLPLTLLILGAICIAFAPIFVRLADPVGPVAVVAWRLGLSIPFVLLMLWHQGDTPADSARQPADARAWLWLVVSGVMLAVDLALWHVSIHMTTVANSTFLINLAPIFVTLGAHWFLGEHFGRGFALALLAALLGAALLVGVSLSSSTRALQGDLVAVLAAVFYAGYQLTVKFCRRHFRVLTILMVTAVTSLVVLAPVVWVMGETVLPSTLQAWLAVIGIALVCQVLGQGLITRAITHIQANLASVVLLVQPVVAAWLAWLLFPDGAMTGLRILGCALVLTGIFFAQRSVRGERTVE